MFHGSMAALVCPMDAAGNVLLDEVKKLVDFHLEAGTDGHRCWRGDGGGGVCDHELGRSKGAFVTEDVAQLIGPRR